MLQEASRLEVITSIHQPSNPQTPGQLKSHYAPNTPLYRGNIETLIEQNMGRKTAVISFQKDYSNRGNLDCYTLSKQGNISEAANQLFAIMREIDAKEYDVILTEIFPEEGIGSAINDRLDRAQFLHK
jgi:L-threonylcarbamoyladenylate synthase